MKALKLILVYALLPILWIATCITPLSAQWSSTHLSDAKSSMGAVALGSKVYFGGGYQNLTYYNKVEIYDVNTNSWTFQGLSEGRAYPVAVACGSKVFFAGGINFSTGELYSVVDIFDTLTQQWSTAQLSQARMGISAVSNGNKVLFAGGVVDGGNGVTDIVDVYDLQSGAWTVSQLSSPRGAMASAVQGDKAYFAGGLSGGANLTDVSDRIDIYNFTTGAWDTAHLSLPRAFCTGVSINDAESPYKGVYFAGGMTQDNHVSARVDFISHLGVHDTAQMLSEPRAFFIQTSISACGRAYIIGGGNLDLPSKSWLSSSDHMDVYEGFSRVGTVTMPFDLINHSVAAIDNQIFIGGGDILSNGNFSNLVSIYTCQPISAIGEPGSANAYFKVYPNPTNGNLYIEKLQGFHQPAFVKVSNMQGQLIFSKEMNDTNDELNLEHLSAGVYLVSIQSAGITQSFKVILQ